MKYFLRICAIGPYPETEISEERFLNLKKSKDCLLAAFSIEEKYELLVSNYLDFEKEVLSISCDYMLRNTNEYSEFFDIRLAFNRRVVNLLTSTKLYIDQIQQHVKTCLPGEADIAKTVKELFSKEYDNYFEYRFMEALRNYVQHRGLAVHSTSLGSRWTSQEENNELEYKTKIYTHRAEVESDKAFKKEVSKEMEEKVELVYAVRSYISSISEVHCVIRDLIKNVINKSRASIESAIIDYENINSGKLVGLNAICSIPQTPIDEIIERVPLLLDWDDVRIKLIKKNSKLVNLRKRYVSSSAYNKKL